MSEKYGLKSTLERAEQIQRTLGTRAAAGFLRNNNVSMCIALHVLARKAKRTQAKPACTCHAAAAR